MLSSPFRIICGLVFLTGLLVLLASACKQEANPTKSTEEIVSAVRAVMEAQKAAWNRGDIDGFMDGYEHADTTTFISGDELTRGWKTVLDRYKQRYASREQMGTLSFSDLDITPTSLSEAVVDGRWMLTREKDKPHGRFTLLFHRVGNNWRIYHDTTTAASP